MAIQSPRDLFYYDCVSMYDIEQKLIRMLPVLARSVWTLKLKQAFMRHEQETRQSIRNLERCFQSLSRQPRALENYTAAGLMRDHDLFRLQQPPSEALTLFNLHSGYQSGCLEIAAYHNLIDEANTLGLQECVQLFQQNLPQEVNASRTLATIAHQFSQQQVQAVHS